MLGHRKTGTESQELRLLLSLMIYRVPHLSFSATCCSTIQIYLKLAYCFFVFHNLKMTDILLYCHQPWLIINFHTKSFPSFI